MNQAHPAVHKTTRAALLWTMVSCLVISGTMVAMFVKDTGEIRYRGDVLRIPVSPGNIRVASDEGRVSYVMLGHPNLTNIFSRRGHAFGWGPGDQFGGVIVIPSASDENLRLLIAIEPQTRFFTRFDFQLRAAPRTQRAGEDCDPRLPAGSPSSLGTVAEESGGPHR